MDPNLFPTTSKVRDTFLKFEDDTLDTPISEIINSKYQMFLETLESIQDRIRHESQIRSESMSVVQKDFEKSSNEILFNLNSDIFNRIDAASANLRASSERLSKLESDFNEFKIQSFHTLGKELKHVQTQLNTITRDFVDQDKISDEITATLHDRVTQLGENSELLVSEQSNALNSSLQSLENRMRSSVDALASNHASLSSSITNELQSLTHALSLASESRKESDGFIASAISEMVNLLPSELLLPSNQLCEGTS